MASDVKRLKEQKRERERAAAAHHRDRAIGVLAKAMEHLHKDHGASILEGKRLMEVEVTALASWYMALVSGVGFTEEEQRRIMERAKTAAPMLQGGHMVEIEFLD